MTANDIIALDRPVSTHAELEGSLFPPSSCSPSAGPNGGLESRATPGSRDDVQLKGTLPSPSQSQGYECRAPDSDEIVESSQTQYLHLVFTPESSRIVPMNPARSPSPTFKLDLGMPGWLRNSSHRSAVHTSTNQEEPSGPAIPKKRARTSSEHSEDTSRIQRPLDDSFAPGPEEETANVPSPNQPSQINMPSELSLRDRLTETETRASGFASSQRHEITPCCVGPARGADVPTTVQHAPTTSSSPRSPGDGHGNPPVKASENCHLPPCFNGLPMHNQVSPPVNPSAQPIGDLSPLSDYNMGPDVNQNHTPPGSQLVDHVPLSLLAQSSTKPISGSNQPHSTTGMHPSPMHSSQSLPPSRSPIKGGRIHPSQSAAGVHGVFGMLGFGSETSYDEDFQLDTSNTAAREPMGAHIPGLFDLPPSSPPQALAHEASREASPAPKHNVIASGLLAHDSPLLRGSPCRGSSPLTEDTRTEEEIETPWESLRPSQSVSQVFEDRLVDEAHVSPLLRGSPCRGSSPLTEDTRTEEEIETPWESLRPSQSVSQVFEDRLVDEAHVSPLLRGSPCRDSSPLTEDTRTEEEIETPWESLRPSQSVSQVFEDRLIEEATEEAQERLRMAQARNAKSDHASDGQTYQRGQGELQPDEDHVLAQPANISPDPRSTNSTSAQLPLMHQQSVELTPESHPMAGHESSTVAPAKVHQEPLVISLLSSTGEEEEYDEDYTIVEEDYLPTESQQSFLDRILEGTSSELG